MPSVLGEEEEEEEELWIGGFRRRGCSHVQLINLIKTNTEFSVAS